MALDPTTISSVEPASPPTTSLTVTWSAVVGATTYLVYQGETLRYSGTATTFTDINLQPGTEYCYTVKCINECSESLSAEVCGETDCVNVLSIPAAPTLLASGETVSVEWGEIGIVANYSVERSLNGSDWTELIVDLVETSYVDDTVSYGNCYYYRIAAHGCSKEYSPSAYICVNCSVPGPVPWLVATPVSDIEIDLAWGTATGAIEYDIYRDSILIDTVSTQTYEDVGLEPDTTYGYCVRSRNDCGDSGGCP